MFTGIIESVGKLANTTTEGSNLRLTIESDLADALKIDQSLSHNGVCLTVEEIDSPYYRVSAIEETLNKSNLGKLKKGDLVNLERSLTLQSLIDGHLVQGHVDATSECIEMKPADGSWLFTFSLPGKFNHLLVEKGSVAINGASLTAFNCKSDRFSVAIIPYTYRNTNFMAIQKGMTVNLEFDIIGKYVNRIMNNQK